MLVTAQCKLAVTVRLAIQRRIEQLRKEGMANKQLKAGMVGMGMIFDETYRPFFEQVNRSPIFDPAYGPLDVSLSAVASRTGSRAEAYGRAAPEGISFESFAEPNSIDSLLGSHVDFVCVATPDDRHFDAARKSLAAGKHVLSRKTVSPLTGRVG